MKQTATEWLFLQMENLITKAEITNMDGNDFIIAKIKLLQKAKEIFQEQIETAFSKGEFFATDYFDADKPNEECSKNYYNETFKSE